MGYNLYLQVHKCYVHSCQLGCRLGCHLEKQLAKVVTFWKVIYTIDYINTIMPYIVDYYIGQKLSYDKLNEVLGVLSAVDFELKRRVVAPYEDKKCNKNGDVYTPRGY